MTLREAVTLCDLCRSSTVETRREDETSTDVMARAVAAEIAAGRVVVLPVNERRSVAKTVCRGCVEDLAKVAL